MKKLLLSIATCIALFSCSSDQPGFGPEIDGNTKSVVFEVSAFNAETSPLKAAITEPGSKQQASFTYAIYKSSGEFVKTGNIFAEYNNPKVTIKEELTIGNYKVIFAMQSVQSDQAIVQPNLNKAFSNASFEYSPSSDCFFKSADLVVGSNGGSLNNISLTRVTGAAEIYISNIESLGNLANEKIKIGAFNIPNAFKISDLSVIYDKPNQYEKEFPMVYYLAEYTHYYKPAQTPANRAFPAVFSGSTKSTGGTGLEGGAIPETFYRYIHTMPTSTMSFKITKNSEIKTVTGFEVKANTLTKLTGSFAGDNNIDVSINPSWSSTPIEATY